MQRHYGSYAKYAQTCYSTSRALYPHTYNCYQLHHQHLRLLHSNSGGGSLKRVVGLFVLLSMLSPKYVAEGAQPLVSLRVQVEASSGDEFRWSVRCSPNSGTHPKLKVVCSKFKSKKFRSLFVENEEEVCTQIFGSNANARITGTVYGKRVNLQLDRRDGCGIALWQSLQLILVKQ
jgi:hypothetical protein